MAIGIVAHVAAQGSGGTGASTTGTPGPIAMTGASVIVIGTSGYFGAPAPSDSNGNTYVQVTTQSDAVTPLYSATWECENPNVTGVMSFFTSGADYYETLDVLGVSGTLTSAAVDAFTSAQTTSGTALQPGSVSVLAGEATITFLAGWWTGGPATINAGFTITDQNVLVNGVNFAAAMAYHLAAASPTNPTWAGVSPAGALQAHIITYKPSTGGGGGGGGPFYYVDIASIGGSASDSNTGTSPSTPWLTLAHAAATAPAGSTILIRGGLYIGAGQTINTTLGTVNSGTVSAPITWSAYPGNLPASTIRGPRPGAEVVVIRPPGPATFAIELTTPAGTAPSYLIFEDLIIDGINNPHSDQVGGGGVPLVYSSGGASFNQFIHLEIKNNGGDGLGFSPNNGASDHHQVLYCLLHDCGLDPTFANSGYGAYLDTNHTLVQGCDFYNNHAYGMQFRGSNNTVRECRFYNNIINVGGSGVGGSSGGGFNFIADSGNPATGNVIFNCLAYGNGFNAAGTNICSATGILIYSYQSSVLCHHNTIYGNTSDGLVFQYYDETLPPTSDNDIAYGNGGAQIVDYGGYQSGAHTAIVHNGLQLNPLFVNPTGTPPNFRVQAGSAAIAGGLYVALVPTDFVGATRPNPPTIGAYEFSSVPLLTVELGLARGGLSYPLDLRTATLNLLTTVLAPGVAPIRPYDVAWLSSGRPPYPVDLRTAAINLLTTTLLVPLPPLHPIDSGLILPRPAYPLDLRTAVVDLLESTLRDRPFVQRDVGMLLTRPYALDLRTALAALLETTLAPGPPPWVIHLDANAPLRPPYPSDLRTAILNLLESTLKPPPIPVPHGQVLIWPASPYRWQTWG
jgi:hypothetical protein